MVHLCLDELGGVGLHFGLEVIDAVEAALLDRLQLLLDRGLHLFLEGCAEAHSCRSTDVKVAAILVRRGALSVDPRFGADELTRHALEIARHQFAPANQSRLQLFPARFRSLRNPVALSWGF